MIAWIYTKLGHKLFDGGIIKRIFYLLSVNRFIKIAWMHKIDVFLFAVYFPNFEFAHVCMNTNFDDENCIQD